MGRGGIQRITFHHDNDFALARYTTTGTIDTTFGTLGKISTDFSGSLNDTGRALAIQPLDGKIIVAGFNDVSDFALARYDVAVSMYLPSIRR